MQIPEITNDPEEFQEEDFFKGKHHNEKNLMCELYAQLQLHKHYFSQMQNKCRNLCSTWVVAAFIGIGFLISKNTHLDPSFNNFLAILIVCICTLCGITLIWHLDIVFYQKFWLAVVVEMARMEKKYPWLPTIHLNILCMRKEKGLRFFQGVFYILCNLLFIFIIGICSIFYFTPDYIIQLIVSFVTPLIMLGTHLIMMKKSGEYEEISTESFR